MTDLRKAAEMALEALDSEPESFVSCTDRLREAREALRRALAQPEREPVAKVWLWRNFVNDKPEYWAFDNPYPINIDNDDPQTIGSPCGYALLKPSRDGSRGRKEDEVLREIKGALAREQTHHRARKTERPEQEPVAFYIYKPTLLHGDLGNVSDGNLPWVYDQDPSSGYSARMLVYAAPPKREWVGLMKGARVEGDKVIIATKDNDTARELCGKLIEEENGG